MSKLEPRIGLRRIYDEPEPGDGTCVLVDRLWPRGLSKERARVDVWLKEVAPSNELRIITKAKMSEEICEKIALVALLNMIAPIIKSAMGRMRISQASASGVSHSATKS